MEDLKTIFFSLLPRATEIFMWEGLAHNRAHRMGAREARDLIARHLFEETGHAEMMFDFVADAFNLDRVRDLYPLNNPHNFSEPLKKWYKKNSREEREWPFRGSRCHFNTDRALDSKGPQPHCGRPNIWPS